MLIALTAVMLAIVGGVLAFLSIGEFDDDSSKEFICWVNLTLLAVCIVDVLL